MSNTIFILFCIQKIEIFQRVVRLVRLSRSHLNRIVFMKVADQAILSYVGWVIAATILLLNRSCSLLIWQQWTESSLIKNLSVWLFQYLIHLSIFIWNSRILVGWWVAAIFQIFSNFETLKTILFWMFHFFSLIQLRLLFVDNLSIKILLLIIWLTIDGYWLLFPNSGQIDWGNVFKWSLFLVAYHKHKIIQIL